MKPSDEIIENFRKIYSEEFGEEISREVACEKFLRLTNFLRVITRIPEHKETITLGADEWIRRSILQLL